MDVVYCLQMKISDEDLIQNMTLAPKIIKRFEKKGLCKAVNQLKDFRFAMGTIIGFFDEKKYRNFLGGTDLDFFSGPNEEAAVTDMYAMFYKDGTFDFEAIGE